LKVSHDINCGDILETFVSQLGEGYPHHKAIHGNCGRPQTSGDNLERKPDLFCEIAERLFFGDGFFHGGGGWLAAGGTVKAPCSIGGMPFLICCSQR